MSTQFNCQNISISNYRIYSNNSNSANFVYTQLNVKTVLYIKIEFSVSTVSMLKTVPFQTIQFSISTQFKYKYSLIVKNISISRVILLCRVAVSVFYSPSRLGNAQS